jgi:hypothetical protein
MFQRVFLAFIVFFHCSVANTAAPIEAGVPILPPATKEVVKPEVPKPEAPKPEAPKPDTIVKEASKPEAVTAEVSKANGITSPEMAPVIPISSPAPLGENSAELLPHRATYRITLYSIKPETNQQGLGIAEANGQMTIQLARAGDGWAYEQKLTLHVYYTDGSVEQVITSLATYESMDGLKYNFNERTLRGDEEEVVSGDAVLASKGGAGIVTYQQPDESTVQLPVGTIFPTQHLISMLQAAKKGQKVVSNIVFDGTSETHEPVQVDTVLGAPQDPKLALTNKDLFNAKKVWPMRMAIYPVDSNARDPEADYEINQQVLDGGVIRDMISDYGTFKVKAVLNQVEVFS